MDVFEEAIMKLAAIKLEMLAEKVAAPGIPAPKGSLTGLKAPGAISTPKAAPPIKVPTMTSVVPQKAMVGVGSDVKGPSVPTGAGGARRG